jgi:hypothetical protein
VQALKEAPTQNIVMLNLLFSISILYYPVCWFNQENFCLIEQKTEEV